MPRVDGTRSISVRPEALERLRVASREHGVSVDALINMMIDGLDIESLRATKPVGSVSMRCSGCQRNVLHRHVSANQRHTRWSCLGCGRSRLVERSRP